MKLYTRPSLLVTPIAKSLPVVDVPPVTLALFILSPISSLWDMEYYISNAYKTCTEPVVEIVEPERLRIVIIAFDPFNSKA